MLLILLSLFCLHYLIPTNAVLIRTLQIAMKKENCCDIGFYLCKFGINWFLHFWITLLSVPIERLL